jgi:hypothetical protein
VGFILKKRIFLNMQLFRKNINDSRFNHISTDNLIKCINALCMSILERIILEVVRTCIRFICIHYKLTCLKQNKFTKRDWLHMPNADF